MALFLDARLGTDEAIVTAVGLRNVAELDAPTRSAVVSVASEALAKATAKKVTPRLWVSFHGLIPAAAAALVAVALAPMPSTTRGTDVWRRKVAAATPNVFRFTNPPASFAISVRCVVD